MIQRVQSIYLLLAAVFSLLLFWLPIHVLLPGATALNEEVYRFSVIGFEQVTHDSAKLIVPSLYLRWLTVLMAAGALAAIFQYKNRKRQLFLCKITMAFVIAFVVEVLLETKSFRSVVGPGHGLHFDVAAAFPFLTLLFLFLAHWAIAKDEALVRSADRLR